ncbi:gliding motility-associated C-terminal domain-containing protein [Hymenobacter persicinus]|uniref:Gliding motility-associated C-terminal domain-containing protein n=1 Tax=Hymenobacter persicinus TaxID=2025506 RepID=A0A4Q5LA53_9BACT|nr:gliding motility-associated C-terminal domain-containing protein [Hymenobacter persicinus]RYU78760.1 gliding motility-associated C-terminal domain-containing protein [Hymenobacter persicinus]
MKKTLRIAYILVVAWCLSLAGMQSAQASHIQGGQLTYVSLGANRYKVTLTVFRDCGGATFPTTADLEYRTTGCSGGPWPKSTMTLVPGSRRIGDPYCATAQYGPSPCGASPRPTNFETGQFETIVTLPPAVEWTLSVSLNARPTLGNIDTASGNCYYEATLNNLIGSAAVGGTRAIENTSAQYDPLNAAIPFVCWRQDTQLSFATTEPDGDSLVYSLAQSLENCGDTVTYQPYATAGIINLTPPGTTNFCAAFIPTGATGTYKPTFPIASFAFTGTCPTKIATPSFLFNPTLGTMTFNPAFFTPGNNMPENKYAVVGKVTEWRRVRNPNGTVTAYKIGSVRRDMLVIVIDCGNNLTPGPPVATGGVKTGVQIVNSRDSTFITAYTCNYTEVRVKFSDPNPTDLLKVTYPELDPAVPTIANPTYLPEDVATFQLLGNETKTPTAILRIKPDVSFVGRTFRIPVKIEDNGCPIKGITYRTIVLRVAKGNFAKVVASSASPFICEGSSVNLKAEPFRPDSVGQNVARYGYRWTPGPGFTLADTAKQTASVRPTQTTRYKVRIVGLDFRMSPTITCFDTASVLVKVRPAITANFNITGRSVAQVGGPNLPKRAFTITNTSVKRTDIDTFVWSYKRVKDGKGNPTADSTEVTFSDQFDPKELTFPEGTGTYRVILRISNKAGTTQCATVAKVQTVVVPDLEVPNVFTPNKDGLNDTFVLSAESEGAGKVQIFNRWGRLIKQYDNYRNEWDGAEQPSGVYYYLVTDKNGTTSKGWVELAR